MITQINTIVDRIHARYILYRYIRPFVKRNRFRKITLENTICLFSQPRSGSTWLVEILNTIPNSCYFDEPLQRNPVARIDELPRAGYKKIKPVSELNFYYEQPIPAETYWPEAFKMFEDLLCGRQISISLYDECGFGKLSNADIFIVKFNFGALLMEWLLQSFPLKAICLIRHPCAVIASQLKMEHFNKVIIPESPALPVFRYYETYLKYYEVYRSIRCTEQYLAFRWAVAVSACLDCNKKNNGVLLVRYEDLLNDFDTQIRHIFLHLGRTVPAEAFSLQRRPSRASSPEAVKGIKNGKSPDEWQHQLDHQQIRNIASVIRHFDIDLYSI